MNRDPCGGWTDKPAAILTKLRKPTQWSSGITPAQRTVTGGLLGGLSSYLIVLVHRKGLAPRVVHASWRTTPGGIAAKTVQTMCEQIDLWQANRAQLVEARIPSEQIVVARIRDHCHTDEFYSYRAEGPTTGRYGLIVGFR